MSSSQSRTNIQPTHCPGESGRSPRQAKGKQKDVHVGRQSVLRKRKRDVNSPMSLVLTILLLDRRMNCPHRHLEVPLYWDVLTWNDNREPIPFKTHTSSLILTTPLLDRSVICLHRHLEVLLYSDVLTWKRKQTLHVSIFPASTSLHCKAAQSMFTSRDIDRVWSQLKKTYQHCKQHHRRWL